MPADQPGTRDRPVLVTGATGYIGGRLVPRLLEAGHRVRCLARSPRKLESRDWAQHPHVEVVAGDAGSPEDLDRALAGCRAAFYLIHSMIVAGADYRDEDRRLAGAFADAAARAGLERIVYLGGLGETGADLSEHLSSRREVEQVLAAGPVPVTVLRAAMIIGSGSASFEILRYLVERLPVMITPRWVGTRCQPIAVRNVLHYLIAALEEPGAAGQTLDIGGPEVMTYRELMQTMVAARGLPRRRIMPVPLLTPRLSSLWIHLVTPLSHRVARPLAEGLRNEVVCRDERALRLMPQELLTIREAIDLALVNLETGLLETRWTDAGPIHGDPDWSGGSVFQDTWRVDIGARADVVFATVCKIGGGNGWYAADWLWRLRGWMDRLVGGPGLRRGRRDPERVEYGDALDFWRVTDVGAPGDGNSPGHLELRAEMKLPGQAELSFRVEPESGPDGEPRTRLYQMARFIPRGLSGLAYWYAVVPLHYVVFRGMLGGIRAAAEAEGATRGAGEIVRLSPEQARDELTRPPEEPTSP